MSNVDIVMSYWQTIDKQEWSKLKNYFATAATVEWPNTNELFIVINNFIRANREYPGSWRIKVERTEEIAIKLLPYQKYA